MISKVICHNNNNRVLELKAQLRLEKENSDDNLLDKMRKDSKRPTSSKSKDREKSKSTKKE